MKTLLILATILTALATTSVSAADTPMQCNLTCKTDYPVPEANTANPLVPAKSVMYEGNQSNVDSLIAEQNGSTGGFDFVTECLKYQGKIWAWREGKCKSMSPDWKSPGIGNFIKQ